MGQPRKFDAGLAESLEVIWKGETYRMVGAVPALLVLKGIRARMNGQLDNDADDSLVLEALEASFEPGELERILRTGIPMETLTSMLSWAQRRWAGAEDEEGEAQPPVTGEPEPSSNASTTLRETSSGSTESTSGPPSEAASTGDGSSPSSTPSPTAPSGD